MLSGVTATIRLGRGRSRAGRRHAELPTPISGRRCMGASVFGHDACIRCADGPSACVGVAHGSREEAADVALLFPQFPIQTTLLIRRLVIGQTAAARHEQNSRKRCARGRDGNVADVMYFRSHSLYFKPLLFRISRLRRMRAPPAAAPYFSSARRPSKRGRINL